MTIADKLRGIADEVEALLRGQASVVDPHSSYPVPPAAPVTYPRMVTIRGTNIMANAPLHPEWRPSQAAWTFGHDNYPDGKPRSFVGDPSNAPEGYTNRSPAGFPLVYPGVRWNGKTWIGKPSGPPQVNCGESNYDSEEAALDSLRRGEASTASGLANDAALAEKVYTGQFPAGNFILGPNEGKEAAFIYAADCLALEKGKGTEFITRRSGLFSGTHADLSRLISYGEQEQIFEHKSYAQTVADMPDTPVKRAVMAALG